MHSSPSITMTICSALVVLNLSLASCRQVGGDHPASQLQHTLASKLSDTHICPSGNSLDLQQIIDSTAPDGMAYQEEGCNRITSTIEIPACLQLAGAGVEKTILYRQPGNLYSGPILLILE